MLGTTALALTLAVLESKNGRSLPTHNRVMFSVLLGASPDLLWERGLVRLLWLSAVATNPPMNAVRAANATAGNDPRATSDAQSIKA